MGVDKPAIKWDSIVAPLAEATVIERLLLSQEKAMQMGNHPLN